MSLTNYPDLHQAVQDWLRRPDLAPYVPDFITLAENRIAYGSAEDSEFPSMPLRLRAMETPQPLVIGAAQAVLNVAGANAITGTLATTPASYQVGLCVALTAAATNTGVTTLDLGLGIIPVVKGSSASPLTGGEIVMGATQNLYYDGSNFVLLPGSAHVPLPSGYLAMREFYIDSDPRRDLEYFVPSDMNRLYPRGLTGTPRAYTIEGDAIRFAPAPDRTYFGGCLYYKKFAALASQEGIR